MQYIRIRFDDGTEGYQEVFNGQLQRTTSLDGATLPIVGAHSLVEANPTAPAWALPDPAVVAENTSPKQITRTQLRDRFTDDEKVAIYAAAKVDVRVQIWLDELSEGTDGIVDLSDRRTIYGLHALEAAGLIGKGRAEEVLNA